MYLSAQKKKIRPFEGFNRRAIVCIPTQEDLKKRTEDRKKEGIELPENAVSDMKSKSQVIHNSDVNNNIPVFLKELWGNLSAATDLIDRILNIIEREFIGGGQLKS